MRSKGFYYLYLLIGSVLLLALSGAHYYGWAFTSTETVTGVPKTVRENPGVYRTHYFGGK